MAILNNSNAISTSASYDINNSLRFRSSASAYLSRTFSSGGDQQKITWSFWVKRGTLGSSQTLLVVGASGSFESTIKFNSTNTLEVLDYTVGGGYRIQLITTQVFRDPSAWYHIVVAIDTTQATAANRVKMYVNGTQVTAFGTATYPSQNLNTNFNINNTYYIGRYYASSTDLLDGYLTEYNFIGGQALTPSSFGETSTTTGSWVPKAYTGTYGTNGFYLKFSDIATTSGSNAGLGKDFSGNANYWTTNNISVTAGVTYDAMIDSPTLTSATVANYATLNPLDTVSTSTPTFANLRTTYSSGIASRKSTIVMTSGKWYTEWNITGSGGGGGDLVIQTVGIISPTATSNAPSSSGVGYYSYGDGTNSQKFVSGVASTYGTYWGNAGTYTLGAALDITGGTITFYLNGVSQGAITLPSNTDGWVFVNSSGTNTGTCTVDNNFGQRPFSYTPPTGFVRLNTYNLPDSTIKKGNLYMDSTLYTGNGTSQTIVNAGAFRPDFVWIKCRTVTEQHQAMDSVRGASKVLNPNQTVAETTDTTKLTAFNSNGFSVGSELAVNTNGATFVGWQWQAGQGSTSSNTSGTITSTVSVNTTAGFSIATYTGNGTSGATVGHGLGVAPKFIIVKTRSNIDNWPVGTAALGWDRHTLLNLTSATAVTSSTWNDTAPTSTVFSIGSDSRVNNSGWTYVAYCWAEIAGFSKFGSYTGNGSADGPFVYTGFRPEWLLVKQSSSAGNNWQLLDTARNTYNKADNALFPSSSAVEGTGNATFDFLSNGFKIRAADGTINTNASTYIFMAFAENPFKNANAR